MAWGSTVVVGVGGVRGAKNKLCNGLHPMSMLLFLILVLFSARIFSSFCQRKRPLKETSQPARRPAALGGAGSVPAESETMAGVSAVWDVPGLPPPDRL